VESGDDGSRDKKSHGDMRIADLLDAEYLIDELLIIAHILKKDKSWVLSHLDETLPDDKVGEILEKINLRKSGYPLHYILGYREFMGMVFEVEEGVFIPRPETETLVEIAADYIKKNKIKKIAEIGVGAGVIGISLARITGVHVSGSDINEKAVNLSLKNAEKNGVKEKVDFRVGEFLEPFRDELEEIELVVSNPPYVEQNYILPKEVKYEPENAIFAGEDGLAFFREYFKRYSRRWSCIMEFSGKDHVKHVLKNLCPEIEFLKDLDGIERFFFCPSERDG
jgi:release factor glutamine methyltransferase